MVDAMSTRDWPAYRGRRNDDLERLIRDYLAEVGRANDEQITDEVERLYRIAGEQVPWLDIDVTIYAMVCGRQLTKTEGTWEDEFFYRLRKRERKETTQPTLF